MSDSKTSDSKTGDSNKATPKVVDANGQCLCGAVSFSAKGAHTQVHACHCGMCRRWSGGSVLATEVESVTFSGEEHIRRFDSSEWAQRGFCSKCGSNLFYFLKPANQYMMWSGVFDDTELFTLTGEIFVDSKPSGYHFAGNHPRLTGEEFMASVGASSEN